VLLNRQSSASCIANVVVAGPAWIDFRNMADLDDVTHGFASKHNRRMRVATK